MDRRYRFQRLKIESGRGFDVLIRHLVAVVLLRNIPRADERFRDCARLLLSAINRRVSTTMRSTRAVPSADHLHASLANLSNSAFKFPREGKRELRLKRIKISGVNSN